MCRHCSLNVFITVKNVYRTLWNIFSKSSFIRCNNIISNNLILWLCISLVFPFYFLLFYLFNISFRSISSDKLQRILFQGMKNNRLPRVNAPGKHKKLAAKRYSLSVLFLQYVFLYFFFSRSLSSSDFKTVFILLK